MKLKSCPFCTKSVAVTCVEGGFDLRVVDDSAQDEPNEFTVVCDYREGGCGASSGWFTSRREAEKRWNKREGEK